MSSLFKLSIQGVRSFDPERHETIQFGFPLTLICGQNGCGKTTIIECLKYATTGDLPPNSKGGAFVNDPSIASRSSVTAQVKLAFLNASGKSMITTRTMQLTKKKTRSGVSSNTFKTLDGQLAVMEKGQKTTMSTKNAELDTSIPIYLGATRAILDYVIFCHQDDSLWPLSEASVLKKRFDDIFEALKFTKVLDNLKVIKKDMVTDIKLIEQSVHHLKIDKERARKINEKVNNLNSLVDSYTEEIASITMKIEEKEKEAESLFLSNQEFQETLSKLDHLRFIQKSYNEQFERLNKSIQKLPDSDEELTAMLNNYENTTNEKAAQVEQLNTETSRLTEGLNSTRNEYNQVIRMEGSLRSKEEAYRENVIKLSNIVRESQESFNVSYSLEELQDPKKVDSFKAIITEELEKLNRNYLNLVSVHQKNELDIENILLERVNSINREKQHQEYCNQDIDGRRKKIGELKKKNELLEYNEGNLEIEKSELESLVSKYEDKKRSLNLSELETKIATDNSKLLTVELEMDELSKKISSSSNQADIHAKISILNETNAHKLTALSKIISSNEENFTRLVGEVFLIETDENLLNVTLSTLNEKINDQKSKLNDKKQETDSIGAILESKLASLKSYENKLNACKKFILRDISEDEIDQYEKILEDLEDDFRDTLEALNTFEVSKQFKIKAIEIAEKDEHCTLCLRSFDSPGLQNFVQLLKDDVNKMNVTELTKNVEIAKKDLEAMKAINSDILQYRKYTQEIEELKSTINEFKSKYSKTKEELSDETKALEELLSKEDGLSSLKNPVHDVFRIKNEMNDSNKQIDSLKEELNDYGASEIPKEELQNLHQEKHIATKKYRQQINDNTELKFFKQKELSRLESNIKDKKLSISHLEKSLLDVTNIKASIDENEQSISEIEKKQSTIKKSLKDLYAKRDLQTDELSNVKEKNRKIRELESGRVEKIKKVVSSFSSCHDSIKSFVKFDLPKLQEIESTIKSLELSTKTSESEIQEVEVKIKSIERLMNESSNIKSNIRDNLEYRNFQKELEKMDNQIQSLDSTNAQLKKDEYQESSRNLRNLLTKLNADYAGKVGEVRQMKDQMRSFKDELVNDYKDIDKVYHEEWIKLQTNMLVSNDIQTYSKALDNAIMKYHSVKMEDINRILGELWRQTYKGTDVDTISIKSDVNVQAKGNRSYNYRVVMYKQDSELDMRGRCSAGQKVLTSILIRLALAECFGANCGMIALDEPTTNLDLENTQSLAEALNKIIEVRKNQKNFQLIVITHDEKFLSHINGDRFTDHFYRVQRDELQKSVIRSLPISLIQED